ncbi:MAG: immunoglobulin-like domain-containing protein [Patescibacteria group bacterium]
MTADISVTANFEADPVIPPTQHTLTTSASTGGTISPLSGPYDDAAEVQITATPSEGYHFDHWSGDLSGSTNPATITMNGDKSVTANFEANPVATYTLTYTAGANGSITGTSPQTVNSGSDGTAVTAVADSGYHFVNWSDASTANPRTDTNVTTNISVTANFAINETPSTPDTTPPVITLNGAAEVTLTVGGTYTELGATAVDVVDASVAVLTTGSVNTAVIGDYTITYTATDAANNTATATRIVRVVAASPTPDTTPAPSGGGSGGGIPITVTFSGQAYPGCAIEVLRKSIQDALFQIIPTESASIKEDGAFEISHSGLISEEYLYALRIKDKDGRKTTLSFDVNLLIQSSFALKDILVPPTVELKNTLLLRAEDLQLVGYVAPSSTVEVEIDGSAQKGTALADKTGYYAFATSVGPLAVSTHYARVRQVNKDGKKSDWSQTKSFKKSLLLALKTDFNNDGRVNIIDWSVFLFRWDSPDQKLRSAIDLDGNGKVDVIDLSIFLKTIQL